MEARSLSFNGDFQPWSCNGRQRIRGDKKEKKPFKNRKTYISQDDNEASFSNESSEEEEGNLCLMVDIVEDETKSNPSDSSSKSNTNYDSLLDAFKELHEET